MNRKKLWSIVGVIAAILIGGGAWYYSTTTAKLAQQDFILGEVKRGDISKRINATGTVQSPSQYNLSFSGKGKVTKITVAVGDAVNAGQVLAEIDSASANQQVLQAKASLAQVKIKLDQLKAGATQVDLLSAQSSLARAEASLYNAKTNLDTFKANPAATEVAIQQATNTLKSAQAEYDLAKAQLDTKKAGTSSSDIQYAQLQVDQAQAALASAEAALADTVLTAPVDGTITAVNGKVGENPGATGAFIVMAGASTEMQIVVPVDESDFANVKTDQAVELTLAAYPNKKFNGKVTQISPTGRTQSNVTLFDVTVVTSNVDKLMKPGMSATISIILAQKSNVLTVPSEAVRRYGDKQTVLIPSGTDSAGSTPRTVKIGLDDGIRAEVLEGLQEGEQVITGNSIQKATGTQGSNQFMGGNSNRSGTSMGIPGR